MNKGDILSAHIPYREGTAEKVRPVVVVQCDRLNWKIRSTMIAVITSNVTLAGSEPSQFLIDPATPDGASSGLPRASAVKCENLFTIEGNSIVKTLGKLSPPLLKKLNESLKAALDL